MENLESVIKNAVGLGLVSISTILIILPVQAIYKDTGIDTKSASLCLEKMEQGLSISELPVASQKLLVIEGVNCLKSAPNINVERPEFKTLFSLSDNIIQESGLQNKTIEDLVINLGSLQADLKSMSQHQALKEVMFFFLWFSIGGIVFAICTLIVVSRQYNIPWL